MSIKELQETIGKIAVPGKGILAADESVSTATKRLEAEGVKSTEESRRKYREMLFTTPHINDFLRGVILYEETLYQKTIKGEAFPDFLSKNGIVPGIKVDGGLIDLEGTESEKITKGIDGLGERLDVYKKAGARFAKWRAVYSISETTPSCLAIRSNAVLLARYASICQAHGIVPIVEPEVLLDGSHSMEECASVTEKVLHAVFREIYRHNVLPELIILKPSMVVPGKLSGEKYDSKSVARETLKVLLRSVPAAVPTINFLSGGQTPEQATESLNEMNSIKSRKPWNLSFSYARALQEPALGAWKGKDANVAAAQKAFYKRAELNSAASLGKYSRKMEGD